jgi:hypothetical protein
MSKNLLDVVNSLPLSDRKFLVRMRDIRRANAAEPTRLSRLRKKVKCSV